MLGPSESVDVFIRRTLARPAADSDDEMVKSFLADSIDSETAVSHGNEKVLSIIISRNS